MGDPCHSVDLFDAEIVGRSIFKLKRGKAAGLNLVSNEHIVHSHPSLVGILARVFNWILICSHVPDLFYHSYTIPIPKEKDNVHSKLTCNDFRGIAISPVIAKIFESCVLDIFGHYFATDDNQFDFKKGIGCSHAILAANKSSHPSPKAAALLV